MAAQTMRRRTCEVEMEIFTTEFFSALLAIVVIDLVLAGDNAIVIALWRARTAAGALISALWCGAPSADCRAQPDDAAVVWLLRVPGLMLAGGVLLVWIAYRLLASDSGDESGHGPSATTSGRDADDPLMRGDGALQRARLWLGPHTARTCWWVPSGLISVPIVIWGSSFI